MTVDRWQRTKQVFEAALELPQAERAGLLDRACADDRALRRGSPWRVVLASLAVGGG
jgi:hypothetical protein